MNDRERRVRDLEMHRLVGEPLVEYLAEYAGCSPRELVVEAEQLRHLVGDRSLEDGVRLIADRDGLDADELLADLHRLQEDLGA